MQRTRRTDVAKTLHKLQCNRQLETTPVAMVGVSSSLTQRSDNDIKVSLWVHTFIYVASITPTAEHDHWPCNWPLVGSKRDSPQSKHWD